MTATVKLKPLIGINLGSQDLRLDVSVPKQYAGIMNVKTVSGNIELGSFSLEKIKLDTVSGGISITQLTTKEASVETVSGDLTGGGLFASQASLSTISGALKLDSFTGQLKLHSVSGDSEIRYKEFTGPCQINTTSGKMKIALPETSNFTLNFESVSGNYTSDFPITVTNSDHKHQIQGNVGSGGPEISVESVSGDLELAFQ